MPYVGDSKRAMDEYTSEIFLGGKSTIAMHNTCEDSLLATPLIYDLVIMAELCERIQVGRQLYYYYFCPFFLFFFFLSTIRPCSDAILNHMIFA